MQTVGARIRTAKPLIIRPTEPQPPTRASAVKRRSCVPSEGRGSFCQEFVEFLWGFSLGSPASPRTPNNMHVRKIGNAKFSVGVWLWISVFLFDRSSYFLFLHHMCNLAFGFATVVVFNPEKLQSDGSLVCWWSVVQTVSSSHHNSSLIEARVIISNKLYIVELGTKTKL